MLRPHFQIDLIENYSETLSAHMGASGSEKLQLFEYVVIGKNNLLTVIKIIKNLLKFFGGS